MKPGKEKTKVCTDTELKTKLELFNSLSNEMKKLQAMRDDIGKFILTEMETRNTNKFNEVSIITERLNEYATAAGKEELKKLHSNDIDKYINVTYSRFVNTRNIEKAVKQC